MKEKEYELVRQARKLFPTIQTKHKDFPSHYVVMRAFYFYVQEQIRHQRWDEVDRVFRFLTGFCKVDPGWENPVRVEFLEDFDFQNQQQKVQSLMGKFLLAWYRSQRDGFKTWTTADRAKRRAEQREFDRAVFGAKPKGKHPPQIRKPVENLTPADFRKFPIWEFASDEEGVEGQDETWVRPVARAQVPPNAHSQLVGAQFTTSKGQKLDGFMIVTTAGDEIEIQPGSIVRRGIYQCLPTIPYAQAVSEKCDWALRDRKDLANALALAERDIFPLRYELRVKVRREKEIRKGVID